MFLPGINIWRLTLWGHLYPSAAEDVTPQLPKLPFHVCCCLYTPCVFYFIFLFFW